MANKEFRKEKKKPSQESSSRKTGSLKEQLLPLLNHQRKESKEVSVIYPVRENSYGEETSSESIKHDGGRKGG